MTKKSNQNEQGKRIQEREREATEDKPDVKQTGDGETDPEKDLPGFQEGLDFLSPSNVVPFEREVYIKQIEEFKRAEKINRVLFRITNAINTTNDLNQLYASIHKTLSQVIDVTNFYIALYDNEKRTLRFPYYKDEQDDEDHDELIVDYDVSDSLTGQVIIDRKPVLLNKEALLERKAQNRIQGVFPLLWLGVPLIADSKVIGVMAVQSYTNPHLFDEKDIKILASVSEQIALAIDRKRAEDQRDALILELRKTLAEIKTLKGIIPICASCKKIRDDKGYWNQVEAYIHDHSDAEFSHSICDECAKELYPDFNLYNDQ